MKGVWLEHLTWPEAKDWFDRGAPVVIPIGAAAKEHGHHLPLSTDYLTAKELGGRIAAALPVVVAPVLGFGYYPAFVRYPGSQNLSAATFMAVLKDLLGNLIRHGVTRIAIVNTGVSTEAPLRIVQRDVLEETGVRVACADIRFFGRAADGLMEQKLGGHGDEHETSVILAIAPNKVRMDRAVTDYGHALSEPKTVFNRAVIFDGDPSSGPDYSVSGVRGDPTLATPEKGRAILAAMEADLVAGLKALFPERLA